jgi:hypothetical protein
LGKSEIAKVADFNFSYYGGPNTACWDHNLGSQVAARLSTYLKRLDKKQGCTRVVTGRKPRIPSTPQSRVILFSFFFFFGVNSKVN